MQKQEVHKTSSGDLIIINNNNKKQSKSNISHKLRLGAIIIRNEQTQYVSQTSFGGHNELRFNRLQCSHTKLPMT